jgi:hypothetical protein
MKRDMCVPFVTAGRSTAIEKVAMVGSNL